MYTTRTLTIGEKEIKLEFGRFSEQADAAVLATCGGTVVHVTVAVGGESNIGYFPLSVEYVEKLFAGGRIKGSRWVKRDGRPTDEAILRGRVIDRSIRPLFPDGLMREVQVIATVLSVDHKNDPDVIALLAVGAAMEISSIPFDGPLAGLRIGYFPDTDAFVFNPTYEEMETSSLDLILSGTADAIVMVEAGGSEVSEAVMLRAFEAGQEQIKNAAAAIAELRKDLGREKFVFEPEQFDEKMMKTLATRFADRISAAVTRRANLEKDDGLNDMVAEMITEDAANAALPLKDMLGKLIKKEARRGTFEKGIRPDGRGLTDIREITCEIDILPSTHGSAMFKRGSTQVLSVVTLGAPSLAQLIEDMEGEEERHYIHHYNMPPYASGETGRVGSPKRREIGHGALAERALFPMIPAQEEFPYTIQVVSEVMSSNGSTSQASVCGSTLSLMAAGVPIKKPVAGIAMGLMSEGKEFRILSDIQGLEDFTGDMDFKVAGTAEGITAIQMDIKVKGLTMEIMTQALEQARVGRLYILDKMLAVIAEPRKELAETAPKIESTMISPSRIGELIGPGGKMINAIRERTGTEINVDDSGRVDVSGMDINGIREAIKIINDMMMEIAPGMEFDGKVVRIEDYGAFIEIVPGQIGLAHVSMLAPGFVQDPRDIVSLDQIVHARVVEVDGDRMRLSLLTPEQEEQVAQERNKRREEGGDRPPRGDRPSFGGGDRGGDRGGFRPRGDRPSYGDRGDRGGDRPRRSFGDRPDRGGDRPRRSFGDRPDRGGDRPRRSFGDRPDRGDREFRPRHRDNDGGSDSSNE